MNRSKSLTNEANVRIPIFASAVVLASVGHSAASGAQIFFSTVGPPVLSDPRDDQSLTVAPEPLTIGEVPYVTLNVGETAALHVWLQPDAPPPNQTFSSVALDVTASNANVAAPIEFAWANPFNRAVDGLRWSGTVLSDLDTGGVPTWIQNAYAVAISQPGIGRSGTGAIFAGDMGRDANTSAFYLGRLDFRATSFGVTGLYFRNGAFRTLLNGMTAPAPLLYGDSTGPVHAGDIRGAGDPITEDLAFADAIVTVCGGAPNISANIHAQEHDGTNVTSGDVRLISAGSGEFRSAGDAHYGRINVADFAGDRNGDLTLYFDLVDDSQAELLVQTLNQAFDRDYEAFLSDFRGKNLDTQSEAIADVAVKFFGRGSAGTSHFFDFEFVNSTSCGAGDIFPVRAIGIPEPGTLALALIGAALFVSRRARPRRSARC